MENQKQVLIHNHFEFGTAPFRVVGLYTIPRPGQIDPIGPPACEVGMCTHCGRGIHHNALIKDAKGVLYAVGTTCVQKTGDAKLISQMDAIKREQKREQKRRELEAKLEAQRAAHDAEMERQRNANGGLTDAEVEAIRIKEQNTQRRIQNEEILAYFLTALDAQNGPFAYDMAANMRDGKMPSGRAREIVLEICVKHHHNITKRHKTFDAKREEMGEMLYAAGKSVELVWPGY